MATMMNCINISKREVLYSVYLVKRIFNHKGRKTALCGQGNIEEDTGSTLQKLLYRTKSEQNLRWTGQLRGMHAVSACSFFSRIHKNMKSTS